jgi:hypothetical protein
MTAAAWSAPICRRSSKASAHCCICALRDMCIVEPIGGFVLSKTLRKRPERVSDVSSGTRSLHPPMTACGHRVRFVANWREEFFEVPSGRGRLHWPLRRGRNSCKHRLDARAVSGGRTDAAFLASSTKAHSRNSGYSLIAANPSGAMLRHGGTGESAMCVCDPLSYRGK